MIIIEGIIGAGKSTFVIELAKLIDGSLLFLEPVENSENPYLEFFYKDMARWGLEMQYYLMAQRFQMHREGIKQEWKNGKITIYDRSIYGDKAFADILHKDGFISDLGYNSYLLMRKAMEQELLVPQCTIFLKVDIETAIKRIQKRNRPCEKGIHADYLRKLERAYEPILEELRAKGSNVQIVDWNQDGLDFSKIKLPEHCKFDLKKIK